ncbi:MAG: hypothetical protein ACFFA8_03095 [Promethearchaeota archaeon]
MIRTYIFDDIRNNWIEENENLLLYDICAFLDEENEKIYLWKGSKTRKDKFQRSYKSISKIVSDTNKNFQIITLKENLPDFVKKRVESMLENAIREEQFEKYKFSKFTTIRLYFLFLLIAIILPLISIINLSSFLFWDINGDNFVIAAKNYRSWLNISYILMVITLILFIFCLIIGIYESEDQVIIFSIIGLIVCIGIVIYLQEGIFLFLFQEGFTSSIYLVKKVDLIIFLILNIIGVTILEAPNFLKILFFIKTYRKYLF